MRFIVFIMLFCSVASGQTTVNGYLGAEWFTYKFENVSDPHVVAAINVMYIDDKNWIKEGTFGYSSMYRTNNLYMGIYFGKKYNNFLLRTGARVMGLLNNEAKTDIGLCALAGYQVNNHLTLNLDYAWLPTNVSLHTFGINALVRVYSE